MDTIKTAFEVAFKKANLKPGDNPWWLSAECAKEFEVKEWLIEEEIWVYFEDACIGFCGQDHSSKEFNSWVIIGNEEAARNKCRWCYYEDYYHDIEITSLNEVKENVYRTCESFKTDDGTTTITITRKYSQFSSIVRLVRYLDAEDMIMLHKNGRIISKGIKHKWNNSAMDGQEVFCFLEENERNWAKEGYVPSVARVVLEVKRDRVHYHTANYESTTNCVREATIAEILPGDIVEFHYLGMMEKDQNTLKEAFEELMSSNDPNEKRIIRKIINDLQDRKVKGVRNFSKLYDKYEVKYM